MSTIKLVTICCGGRNNLYEKDWQWFFSRTQSNLIIVGGALGADSIAEKLAYARGIEVKVMKPDWNLHGKSAGFKRNMAMAEFAQLLELKLGSATQVVASAGGKGTVHMIETGRKFGYKVHLIEGKGS